MMRHVADIRNRSCHAVTERMFARNVISNRVRSMNCGIGNPEGWEADVIVQSCSQRIAEACLQFTICSSTVIRHAYVRCARKGCCREEGMVLPDIVSSKSLETTVKDSNSCTKDRALIGT